MHVLLVAPVPPPYGGIANWTRMVLEHSKQRDDVRIDTVNISPTWRRIHQTGFALRAVGGSVQLVGDLTRILVKLVSMRYDVLHLTTSGHLACFRDIAVLGAARLFGVRCVYHIRFGRVPEVARGGTWEWQILRVALVLASAVIAIDVNTQKAIIDSKENAAVFMTPNCVESVDELLPTRGNDEARVVIFIGWVVPAKGLAELLHAWAIAKRDGWRLEIVGPCDAAYEAELRRAFPVEGVEFLGEMSHRLAMERLAASDIFVLPSHTEGFPNVVLEAMIRARAIVGTDVGAIPEMLEKGAGLVVPVKDVDALAGVMGVLMDDFELRRRLGEVAAAKASREYSLSAVFEKYLDIWRLSGAN